MTGKVIQMALDEPSIVTDSDREHLASFLNWNPLRSIKLLHRYNDTRGQLRFFSSDIREVQWAKWTLLLTGPVRQYRGIWKVEVTDSEQVLGIIRMLKQFLNATAKKRALLVTEALGESVAPDRVIEILGMFQSKSKDFIKPR